MNICYAYININNTPPPNPPDAPVKVCVTDIEKCS